MAHVQVIDQTIRDGNQSLWGMRMQAGMALPVAPLIDRTGYSTVDLVGSSMFEIMVRHAHEDPWAGLDLIVGAMPRTPIRAGLRCHGIITMSVTPDDLMDLWVRRLCEHGVRSFWIHDPLHVNLDKLHRLAKVANWVQPYETGTGVYVSPDDTGTSPTNGDTDGDGLSDREEVNRYHSNPNVKDTDGDGFEDGFEVTTGFDPSSATSTPETPCSSASGIPPCRVARTGSPLAIASSIAFGTPS